MAHLTPIRDVVAAMMLSLRRRYLERSIDGPFDAEVSRELDRVIEAQEELNPIPRLRERRRRTR